MRGVAPAKSVDAYLKAAPDAARPKLVQLRKIVRTLAPKAQVSISYGMPYYKLDGALVGFAAFKNHIGFFPGAIVKDFARELAGYKTSKGTVQLPLDAGLPVALIKTLIRASMRRNAEKASKRTATRKRPVARK
jgi:uncharacterized protein YdhG (YjbR/CyaY superfamily)